MLFESLSLCRQNLCYSCTFCVQNALSRLIPYSSEPDNDHKDGNAEMQNCLCFSETIGKRAMAILPDLEPHLHENHTYINELQAIDVQSGGLKPTHQKRLYPNNLKFFLFVLALSSLLMSFTLYFNVKFQGVEKEYFYTSEYQDDRRKRKSQIAICQFMPKINVCRSVYLIGMQKRKLSLDQNIFAKELYRIRIGLFINLFSMIIPWLIVLHLYRAGQSQRAKQKQDEANQNMELNSGSIIVSQSDGEARLSQMVDEVINHLNEGFESMKVEQINQSLLSTEESDAGMLKSIPLNEITDLNGLDRKEIILVPIEFQNNLSQMGLSLTVREIRLLYYIYLGFTNSDLEKILAISDLAVRKAKNRVKKKIGIPKETKLDAWVRNILFPITRT